MLNSRLVFAAYRPYYGLTMVDDLKKIKDLIEIIVSKIRSLEMHQGVVSENIRTIRDQQSVMNEKLDNHTASLLKIEDTLEGYADMYKVNKEKDEELEDRVEAVEKKAGISKNN